MNSLPLPTLRTALHWEMGVGQASVGLAHYPLQSGSSELPKTQRTGPTSKSNSPLRGRAMIQFLFRFY